MKKSAKPIIAYGLFISVLLTLFFLGYVGIKLNCERMIKEKVIAEEILSAKKNHRINLLAQHQFLSAEARIVEIATNELGMIKRNSPDMILSVSKEKINEISLKLEDTND
jgi:hypothetical protein